MEITTVWLQFLNISRLILTVDYQRQSFWLDIKLLVLLGLSCSQLLQEIFMIRSVQRPPLKVWD